MSHYPDDFTPETVDEQIEYLAQQAPVQPEETGQQLVYQLRRLYQAQAATQSATALEQAWERITHSDIYLARHDHARQQGKQEERLLGMKTKLETITDIPHDNLDITMPPPTRIRRISRFMQTLVAVLLVGVLVGGLLILFASRHVGTAIYGKPGSHILQQSIIVASTFAGTIYAMQPGNGAILWRYATGKPLNGTSLGESTIVVQGDVVYFIENNYAYAFNAANGNILWTRVLKASAVSYSTILVDSGIVYITGAGADYVYGLQAKSGTVLWSRQTHYETLLTAAGGNIYTTASDTASGTILMAFNGENGRMLWQSDTPAYTAVVAQNTIYVTSEHKQTGLAASNKEEKSLSALNTKNGKLLWSKPVVDYDANPLVFVNNTLISGLTIANGYRYCSYHAKDGSQIWCLGSKTVPALGGVTNYIVVNNILYTTTEPSFNSLTCQLEAREVSNGSLLWSHVCPEKMETPSIVGLNGTLFIAGNGNVAATAQSNSSNTIVNALDSHGNILWTVPLNSNLVSLAASS